MNLVEQMLIEDGIILIKFWFSIKIEEQKERIQQRLSSPLMQWKVSPVDLAAQEKWADFTKYKNLMFERTHTPLSPWIIIRCQEKEDSRIQAMRYLISKINYADKSNDLPAPDKEKLFKWKRY